MPKADDDQITLVAVPPANTDAMVTLLSDLFDQMLNQLPFPFSHGDVMSAALYQVIDSGLANSAPEKLREDIAAGVGRILAERAAEKRAKN